MLPCISLWQVGPSQLTWVAAESGGGGGYRNSDGEAASPWHSIPLFANKAAGYVRYDYTHASLSRLSRPPFFSCTSWPPHPMQPRPCSERAWPPSATALWHQPRTQPSVSVARHFRWFAHMPHRVTCAHSQTGHPSRMSQWQWHLHEMGSVHLALAWWPGQNTSLTNPPPKTPCMPTPSTSAQHAQLCQRDPPVHHREDGGCNIDATQPHCPGLEQGWLAPVLPRPAVLELRLPAADMGGSAVGQ